MLLHSNVQSIVLYYYMLTLTESLSGDASAEIVKKAILNLPYIHPDTVQVEKEETKKGIQYTVIFMSEKGKGLSVR